MSRLITPPNHKVTLVILIADIHTKSPDPVGRENTSDGQVLS